MTGVNPQRTKGAASGGCESAMFSTAGFLERKSEMGNSMTATVSNTSNYGTGTYVLFCLILTPTL